VTSRGDRQEAIFDDDQDRTTFLNVLSEVVSRFAGAAKEDLEEDLGSNLLLTVKRETSLKVRQSEFRRGQDASELGGLGEWSADCERARGTAEFYKPRHALWLSGMDDEDR
jgi:hypothetical protein